MRKTNLQLKFSGNPDLPLKTSAKLASENRFSVTLEPKIYLIVDEFVVLPKFRFLNVFD